MRVSLGELRLRLHRRGFIKNVLILAAGTGIGQVLVVLASPVLTRLYSPEDFGILAVYVSTLSFLVVVASFRYHLAIPLSDDDVTAANILVLSTFIVFVFSIFTGLVVLFWGERIVRWLNEPMLGKWLWLLPFSLFGAGVYQVFNFWAVRKKYFDRIAKTKLTQSLGQVLAQISFGLCNSGPLGLLFGDAVGRVSGSSALITLTWQKSKHCFTAVSIPEICRAAYRYRRFPLLSSGSALLNNAGLQLPPLLLAVLYGTQVAGWFALGQRVISIPMLLVGQAVAQVYYSEASRLSLEDPKALKTLFLKTARGLLTWGLVPIGLLAVGGPWFFVFVFGEAWRDAGGYVQLLSLMFLIQFVVVPLSQTLNVLERQDWQLIWDTMRFILVVGGIVVAYALKWPAWTAVMIYGLLMLFSYLGLFILSNIAILKHLEKIKDERVKE